MPLIDLYKISTKKMWKNMKTNKKGELKKKSQEYSL